VNGDGVVRVLVRISEDGDGTGLGLELCLGQLCLNVNSTTKDEIFELHLVCDTKDNERCPRRMDRKDTIVDDVAQYDVVHVMPSGKEVGLSRGEGNPVFSRYCLVCDEAVGSGCRLRSPCGFGIAAKLRSTFGSRLLKVMDIH